MSIKDSEVTLSFIADAFSPASTTRESRRTSMSAAPTPSTEATEASPFKRLTGYFGGNPPEPVTPETTKPTPEPCSCLVALRLGIFFVLYPAVISYLWFYYIPTRSIPK